MESSFDNIPDKETLRLTANNGNKSDMAPSASMSTTGGQSLTLPPTFKRSLTTGSEKTTKTANTVRSMWSQRLQTTTLQEGRDCSTNKNLDNPGDNGFRKMSGDRVDPGKIAAWSSEMTQNGQHRRYGRRTKKFFHCCNVVVDSNFMVMVTTVMTIWVLVCDDIRVIYTEKPADNVFEYLLIACMAVFGLELILACFGKEDYFMGFFFLLDLVSTGSLVLDLPSIQEKMAEDDGGIGTSKHSNTARIGAKAARVVRIVRLVRIVKLYKIAIQHFEKYMDSWMGTAPMPGEDSTFMDTSDDADDEGGTKKESRVGKQLSQITLKRVIVLILAMLVVVPSLSAQETYKYSGSSDFGADEVWQTFTAMKHGHVSRRFYEKSMLRFIYYHNWFTGNDKCPSGKAKPACPSMYYNHVFWLGVAGRHPGTVQSDALQAQLSYQTVVQWNINVSNRNDLYNFGGMPASVQTIMGSPWTSDCSRTLQSGIKETVLGFSFISQSAGGRVKHIINCPSDLRATEFERFYPRLINVHTARISHFVFFFDMRKFLKEEAVYGIIITAYVCVALVIAVMIFASDANRLVLGPLESMIAKVQIIREDPLSAIKMGDQEFKAEEQERIRKKRSALRMTTSGPLARLLKMLHSVTRFCMAQQDKGGQPMETLILEKTLLKLGALLALGFGEAGANIINKNMCSEDTATVDVMIAGDRVECIYAQARVQDFSVVTEVLQSKVMTFVNQIAEIVHGVVVAFNGGANKNFGDTFLLVWRSYRRETKTLTKLASSSIAAFCKILAALQRSPALGAYRAHPRLQFLLGMQYRVCLNIGVHAGWAFEGAMGSEYKIDASYISPNLTITGNVEQATQHFRSSFLVTHSVVQLCAQPVKKVCRLIDIVIIPGRSEPLQLYCVDLDVAILQVERLPPLAHAWNPRVRYQARQYLESERQRTWADNNYPARVIQEDGDIKLMRRRYTEEFLETFKMGFMNYQDGEWRTAHVYLLDAVRILGGPDGPSESLLSFMQQSKFTAPKEWRGSREILPLLQGPPKHHPRPPHDDPVCLNSPCPPPGTPNNRRDSNALYGNGGATQDDDYDNKVPWTLPHAVPQKNDSGLALLDPFAPIEKSQSTKLGDDLDSDGSEGAESC